MWLVVINALAALIQPQGCGPLTEALAHYYPHATSNLGVRCNQNISTAANWQQPDAHTIILNCRSDVECAQMLQKIVTGYNTNDLNTLNAFARYLNTDSAACINATDCVVPEMFDCIDVVNGTGYCAPKLLDKHRTWDAACFDGAHSTCTEMLINLIGVVAGTLLSLGEMMIHK